MLCPKMEVIFKTGYTVIIVLKIISGNELMRFALIVF